MSKQELADRYGAMDEDALLSVAKSYDSLTDEAQEAIREEFQKRNMEPPTIYDERMSFRQLATVARFTTLTEAMAARAALEAAGIPCFLQDENVVRIDWFYANFIGGLRLQVEPEDEADAREVLTAPMPEFIAQPGQPDFIQPVCPQCGSTDLEIWPTRAIQRLDGDVVDPSAETWRCKHCKCIWSDDQPDTLSAG